MEKLTIWVKMSLIIVLEYFNALVGQEYKPWDLLLGKANISNSTSLAVTGLNMKELAGDFVFVENRDDHQKQVFYTQIFFQQMQNALLAY